VIRRIEAWAVPFLLVVLLTCPAPGQTETVNEIVAVVNGEAITRFELQNTMNSSLASSRVGPKVAQMKGDADEERRVLRSMINEMLFRQEADRLGITVSDETVRSRLEQIRRKNGLSREELKAYLARQGRDLSQFQDMIRRKIKVNRLLGSMVQQKVVVTEQELRDYFEKHKRELLGPRRISLSLILMQDKQKLKALRARISKGELSFAEAARRHSRGPNADSGGDLGEMTSKDLSSGVRRVVQGLEPDEMSEVFSLKDGYAVVHLDKVLSSGKGDAFSRVRDKMRKKIYSRKVRQRYREYVGKLRSKAVIDIRL